MELWLAEPTQHETVRFEILLKMYFSSLKNEDIMIRNIVEFEKNHQKQLAVLNMFQKELTAVRNINNHDGILRMIDWSKSIFSLFGLEQRNN